MVAIALIPVAHIQFLEVFILDMPVFASMKFHALMNFMSLLN